MIGIDIGSNSVKIAELSYEGGTYRLENAGEAMLPSGAITGKSVSRGEVVSEVISNLVSGLGIKTKKVVIGISGEAVASRIVDVPRRFLRKDMEKLTPDLVSISLFRNIERVNYSYTPLSRRNGKSGEIPVLIVAVSKERVQRYKNSVSSAGLRAKIIDIDSMALSNAHSVSCGDGGGKVALVNIGASVINLSILNDGVPFLLRDIPLGGEWITLRLMEKFKITYEEAERIKCSIKGYGRYEDIKAIFSDFAVRVADEIKAVLSESGNGLARIILSGGSSRIATMADVLGEATGVAVEISNPFQNIGVSDSHFDPEYIEHLAPKMAVAVGLALRGL